MRCASFPKFDDRISKINGYSIFDYVDRIPQKNGYSVILDFGLFKCPKSSIVSKYR
jgi:hypothetical protein